MVEMDKHHYQKDGTLEGIVFPEDSVATATIDFRGVDEDEVNEGYSTKRFALDQILRFTDLSKTQLKNARDEGEDISEIVLNATEGETFKFLYGTGDRKVYSVVSPKFQAIPTEQLDDMLTQEVNRQGLSVEEKNVSMSSGELITRVEYTLGVNKEVESTGDVVQAGLWLENSVFGARALKVGRFYEVLACENGMTLPESETEFRQVHMGDRETIEAKFTTEVGQQIWQLWEEVEFIERANEIEFPVEDQIEWIEQLTEEGNLTQKASEALQEIIEEGEHNSGTDSVWSLINAFTGRAEHGEVSRSEMNTLESLYTQLLQAESQEEVVALAEA